MQKKYGKKWFQLDLARQRTFVREEAEQLLSVLHNCGYNGMALYLEGYFEFPEFKGIPREGCMNADDAKWICETAKKYDIEIIPMTNLVGHANSFLGQECFGKLGQYCNDYQFDMKTEGFKEFAKSIIDQLIECFNPKFIHIGGDEVKLSSEDMKDYAVFLSEICIYLENKGIQTGIWGDMLYRHPEIAETMRKDIWVFDWWYYGHRIETPKMLREMGFENIVICPATQSWDGIVGTQLICPWHRDVPWKVISIGPDEVEAFLIDGQEQECYDALLTDWENYQGHLIWNSLHMIARFGQFVNNKDLSDAQLNEVIFGKTTPYMKIMYKMMEAQAFFYEELDKLPGRFVAHQHGVDGIFSLSAMSKTLQCGDSMSEEVIQIFEKTANEVEDILKKWDVDSSLEYRTKRHLQFAVCYTRAVSKMLSIAHYTKKTYREASLVQFKNPQKYAELLTNVCTDFVEFANYYNVLKITLENAIKDSGHTKNDIGMLDIMKEKLEKLIMNIEHFSLLGKEYKKNISLPSWTRIICENIAAIDVNT